MRKCTAIVSAIVLMLTAALTGCANVDGETANRSSDGVSMSASDTSSNPVEFTSAVGEVDEEEFPTKCKIYKQKPKIFTEEQLLGFFSEASERTSYSERNLSVYTAETERGNTNGTDLNFSTDAGILCNMAFDTVGTIYEGEQVKNASLAFASIDELLEEIGKKMTEFGFASDEWFADKVYTLTKDDLERYKEATYNAILDNPYSLDEGEIQNQIEYADKVKQYPSKDSYFISFGFKLDDIKIFAGGNLTYGGDAFYSILGSRCKICYSEDGFESIMISNVCETDTYEDVEIIAPDKAKELINKKYSDIIFDGEVKVNSIELIYLPIPHNDLGDFHNKFETRPSYAFYCTVTEEFYGEMISKDTVTYFDAVTGNELATQTASYI